MRQGGLTVVALVTAWALRVWALHSRPLWYDEAFAVLFAEKGFRAMLAGTLTPVGGAAADVHPVVYYTMLNGWMTWLGGSPLAVRLLSAMMGMLTVAVAFAIGRHLFGKRAGLASAAVLAVSPFHVYYSQEARMYAGLALACALCALFLLKALRYRAARYWVFFSVSAAAAMYMHNLAAVFLLALAISLMPRPKDFARLAAAGAGAFVLWLPWFANLPGQVAKLRSAYWVTRPDRVSLLQTAMVYVAGEELLAAREALPLALFTALLLPIILIVRLLAARGDEARKRIAVRAGWCAALAAGVPVLLFLASYVQPLYIQRALLPAAILYAVLLGWLLSDTAVPGAVRFALAAALISVSIAGLWAHFQFSQFPRPNFRAVATYLQEHAGDSDVIIHSNKLTFLPTHYYDRLLPQHYLADPPGSGSDTLALPTQETLGLLATTDLAEVVDDASQVWLVIFQRALDEYQPQAHPHLQWLAERFVKMGEVRIDDVLVIEFREGMP